MNVRLAYRVPLSGRAGIDVIGEAFNLLNRINYDVNSIINGEFLSGPTLANPALARVVNRASASSRRRFPRANVSSA